jgi:hypothetical protein
MYLFVNRLRIDSFGYEGESDTAEEIAEAVNCGVFND